MSTASRAYGATPRAFKLTRRFLRPGDYGQRDSVHERREAYDECRDVADQFVEALDKSFRSGDPMDSVDTGLSVVNEELHRIYEYYCSFGDYTNVDRMTSTKLHKMATDCQLYDRTLSKVDIDLFFIQVLRSHGKVRLAVRVETSKSTHLLSLSHLLACLLFYPPSLSSGDSPGPSGLCRVLRSARAHCQKTLPSGATI
jgi:hypothetical protein